MLAWRAPSFRYVRRGWLWFVGMLTGFAVMLAFAYWQDSLPLAIALVLIVVIYLLTHHHLPEMEDYQLTDNALVTPRQVYYLADLQQFFVLHDPDTHLSELHLRKKKGAQRAVVIQLGGLDPELLTDALSLAVAMDSEREETLTEKWIRVLKL